MERAWIKSKDSLWNVHGWVKSSTWNSRFGGISEGWMGERSVATTDAEGY